MKSNLSRRSFLLSSTIAAAGIIATKLLPKKSFAQAPGIVTSDKMRPKIPYDVAVILMLIARLFGVVAINQHG